MLVSLKEWRQRSRLSAELREALKLRVGAVFGLGPDDAVSVNEIGCRDAGCPDRETVILIMRASETTRAVKLPLPMSDVTDIDLEAASACLGLRPKPAGRPPTSA